MDTYNEVFGGARNDSDVEEQFGGKVGSEAGRGASDLALAGGMGRMAGVESGGGRRRENRIREMQRKGSKVAWGGVWGRSFVEEKEARGTAGKAELHAGRWDLSRGQGDDR